MKTMKKIIAILMCMVMCHVSFNYYEVDAEDEVKEILPIDKEHFPDDRFRECVKINSDKDDDDYLDNYEILYTWNMYCENSGIKSLKGIEHFPYLKGLWCKGNHISELDLSGNPNLEGVWCSFNDLTELDFSPCPKLTWVYCFNCKLEKLQFKDNPKLAYLECNANPNLKEIDVSNNPELENLFCSHCSLKTLDVSNNPLLCELTCFYNNLKTLDVSNNTLLKRLDVWHNPNLKDVDISGLKELQYYNCAWTAAKNVNLKNNKHLLELVCGYNDGITSLDLSHNPELAFLTVECDTKLKSLDLSHNPKLYYLMAFGLSSINSIDLSKNYRLCKAYNEGKYVHETEKLGAVYSKTLDYGGSSDPFDELRHCVALDDRISGTKVNAKFNGKNVPDCRLDVNDGLASNNQFITRGQAIETLYQLAGKPKAKNKTRFSDVPSDASYYDAVRWGEANKICFGYPIICDNKFKGEELINRQDFALMAHRFADYMKLGTALDYGRSDWYKDSLDMDFYAWAPFTWALQWKVVHIEDGQEYCYPHGRISYKEFKKGLENLMDLDVGASYAQRVGGNFGEGAGIGYVEDNDGKKIKITIPKTFPGTTEDIYGNKMLTLQKKEKQIESLVDEKDVAGSTFSILKAKQKKVTKKSITISWNKVKGADYYVIYGNKCGKHNKYKKIKTVLKTTFTQKKLKKGTYYKYIVVAVGNERARAVSKTIHISTKGGKSGNAKYIKVKKTVFKLKKGKSASVKATQKTNSRKLKIKKHRKLLYESSNPTIATVSKKGKIKARHRGSCKIYIYAQNGIYKMVKVTVK